MKMTFKEVSFFCECNGICIYEQRDKKDGRKRYYKMLIPIFEEGKVIPVRNEEYLVKTIKECYQHTKKLLEDDKFRANTAAWVRSW